MVLAVVLSVVPKVTIPQAIPVFTVRSIAPEHSSFDGGGGGDPKQISKFELVAELHLLYKHEHNKFDLL